MANIGTDVYFNSNNLSAITGIDILDRQINDTGSRDLKKSKIARSDKSVLTSAEYSEKSIVLKGIAYGIDRDDAENIMASLMALVQDVNGTLQLTRFGISVTYTATLNTFKTDFFGGNCIFSLEFVATDPLAYETTTTQYIQPNNITTSTGTFATNGLGSFKIEPIFTVRVVSKTGTSNMITVKNNNTGSGITVTRAWTAGEIMVIDCINKTVQVDGADVAYTGLFPSFNIGVGSVGYIDDFTARSVVLSAVYTRRFV